MNPYRKFMLITIYILFADEQPAELQDGLTGKSQKLLLDFSWICLAMLGITFNHITSHQYNYLWWPKKIICILDGNRLLLIFEKWFLNLFTYIHSGPEALKKSRPKKLVKSNKSISRKFFWPKSIFCNFKNGQKSIFELGKSLKLPKMQFHENFFWFIWFHKFFAWTFLNFLIQWR